MSAEWNIFVKAVEIADPQQRAFFLDEACADQHVRARVEKMLTFDPKSSFLGEDEVPDGVPQCDPESPSDLLGHSFGRYTLRAVIGEGGFGVVYRAEQTETIQRSVALKVIKLGMDTRQVIARFETERQVLALMDHPNIAKVHDGGASDTGRPYFVMELVDGLPITQFCDENKLSLTQRLRLVADVCRAVHHAHQKGIIHRDIKPTNVLVTIQDNQPVPKIIDFGIAKATQPTSSGRAALTRFQQPLGTPAYMSPEHLAEEKNDIDTRSDVYSIGVMLYELLTGTTPLQEETLRVSTFDEIGRLIRDQPSPKPSSRLRSLDNELDSVAMQRSSVPSQIQRYTKGELDWIVMKALEKDRERRYDSAAALAADLEAFLRREPIQAAPPSLAYRSQKFVQRQWKVISLLSAVFTLLLLSSVISIVSLLTAWHELERKTELKYAADVSFAAATIESGNIELAKDVLLPHMGSNLRSFPWDFLWRKLNQFMASLDHETPAHDVVFSNDGKSLISLGESGHVRVWSLSNEENRSHLMKCDMATAMTGAILDDVLAVGGRRKKGWGSDGVVEFWNWRTRERTGQLVLDAGTGCIVRMEFIPNSSTLLVASVDDLFAYDLDAGVKQWELKRTSVGYRGTETRALAVSRDGSLIATNNRETGILILDSESGKPVGEPFSLLPSVRCLKFLGDGRHLAVGQLLPTNQDTVHILNLDTRAVSPVIASKFGSESIDCLGEENILASINWRGGVTIWDLKSNRQVGSVPAHANAPGALKFSSDGKTLATCGHDGTVKLWETRKLLTRVAPPPTPNRETVSWYVFSNDNKSVVSSASSSFPKRWDVETGELLIEYTGLPATLTSAPQTAFSPNDRFLAAIDTDNRVVVWDALSGKLIRQLQLKASSAIAHFLLAFSSDGKRLSLGGVEKLPGGGFSVQFQEWDWETGNASDESGLTRLREQATPISPSSSGYPHFRIRAGGWQGRMRLSPDRKLLAFGIDSQLFLADIRSQRVTRFDEMEHVIVPVEFSRDGTYVAAAGQSTKIRVWNTETGAQAFEFDAPLWPGVLTFSPDGKTLVAGYYDGSIGFWDLGIEREILQIKAHTFPVTTLKFSSDGKTLASGGWDGEIRLWRSGI